MSKLLSLTEASALIRIEEERILQDLGSNKILAVWQDKKWFFDRRDLHQYYDAHYEMHHSTNSLSKINSITRTELESRYRQGERDFIGEFAKSKSDFSSLNLSEIDLACCFFVAVDFADSILRKAIMYESALNNVNFTGTDLSNAWLEESDLRDCNFHHANLTSSNLRGANLEGANFRRANLTNCNMAGANLSGVNFTEALFLNTQVWHNVPLSITS